MKIKKSILNKKGCNGTEVPKLIYTPCDLCFAVTAPNFLTFNNKNYAKHKSECQRTDYGSRSNH
jgi:hypothetical protein